VEDDVLKVFNEIDTDSNGLIGSSEIKSYFNTKLMKTLDDDELEYMIRIADLNNDRTINFSEFKRIIQLCNAPKDPDLANQMMETFANVDLDNDGTLNLIEFSKCLEYLEYDSKEVSVETLFHDSDTNHDGKINFSEFVALVTRLLEQLHEDSDE